MSDEAPLSAPGPLPGGEPSPAPQPPNPGNLADSGPLPASEFSTAPPPFPAPFYPPARPPLHTQSLVLAIFNGLALLVAGLAALAFFITGLYDINGRGGIESARASFSYTWIAILVAAIQVPALVFNIARLNRRRLGRDALAGPGLLPATLLLLIAWPLALAGGTFLSQASSGQAAFLMGLVQVVAVALPIWWLVMLGRRGLRGSSLQRGWGLASVSTAFTVPLIVLAETIGLIAAVAFGVVVVLSQPELASRMQSLLNSLRVGAADPQEILSMLEPYLNQPWVIFAIFAAIAGFAPMLEELLKPLAAWFLARREITPAQGFTAGLVAGACFAMLESLTYVNSTIGAAYPGDPLATWTWALSVVVRSGTAMVHMACTALVGWGLAAAWRRERYLRLGGMFLLAVAIHGSWNALALLQGFGELFPTNRLGSLQGAAGYAWIGMLLLLAFSLGVLIFANRYIRARQDAEDADLTAAPPSFDPYTPY